MFTRRNPTACVIVLLGACCGMAAAQEPSKTAPPLPDRQRQIEQHYREFEAVVQRMADLLRQEDPERAALMMKVFSRSRSDLVVVQMEKISQRLKEGDLDEAAKLQDLVLTDMSELLELLLSENRAEELRQRRERIEKYLEELREVKDQQRNLRLETERSDEDAQSQHLAEKQQKLAEQTDQLRDRIQKEESQSDESQDSQDPKGEKADPKDGESKDGSPDDSEPPKDAKPDEDSDAKDSSSKDAAGKKSSGEAGDEQMPRAENLKKASQSMQQAQKHLQELKRRRAAESQDEAIRELDKAIEELEELLSQLREEERQELLASLEERFREMFDLQQVLYDATVRLDQTPVEKRTRVDTQQILALSRREAEIVAQAEQCLLVLRDDGTALAFPEAVQQLIDDMTLVSSLLGKAETGSFTQQLEQGVLDALAEMIQALQREQEESKQRNQQPQQEAQGSQQQPLVQKLAELKMIRTLQQRVNDRTAQLQQQADQGRPLTGELRQAARQLAQRQARIYAITREIALEMKQP